MMRLPRSSPIDGGDELIGVHDVDLDYSQSGPISRRRVADHIFSYTIAQLVNVFEVNYDTQNAAMTIFCNFVTIRVTLD